MGIKLRTLSEVLDESKVYEEDKVSGFIGPFIVGEFMKDKKAVKIAESEIEGKILKLTGAKVKVDLKLSGKSITFETSPIKTTPLIFKELTIGTFNSSINLNGGVWWFSCNYNYKLMSGGSNGNTIFSAWILPNGKIADSRDWS